jgi:hypothetical protein
MRPFFRNEDKILADMFDFGFVFGELKPVDCPDVLETISIEDAAIKVGRLGNVMLLAKTCYN